MSRLPDKTECRDLYNAAAQGDTDGLMNKIASGLSPDCQNEDSNWASPLHGATKMALQNGNMGAFDYLMTLNPDTNIVDNNGLVPLMLASLGNNAAMVTSLLSHGADSNKQMQGGATALHLAAMNKASEVVNLLLVANPSLAMTLDAHGKSALESQIVHGYNRSSELRLNDLYQAHPDNLMYAKAKNNMEQTLSTIKLLLEYGAPCSASCQETLFANPDLKAAADLYSANQDHSGL